MRRDHLETKAVQPFFIIFSNNMRLIENFKYRPEIDGLRAIAVLAVVLFHSGFGFPGGFIGVDVFFVISGYLITSLIWKDLEAGKFTFKSFWERRARRILPALIVMTVAVLIAGWFLMFPNDLEALGKATIAQAVFAANIYYWKGTGYFQGAAEEKPLLHTWSLATEEQFYLLVPFLLAGLFSFVALRGRQVLLILLGIAFSASLALSIYGIEVASSATFYLLPTRAWEMLLGSLIAFLPQIQRTKRNSVLMDLVGFAGLLLVIVTCFVYSSTTPFPGLTAMVPTLGTAAIIWASRTDSKDRPTKLGAFLSVRPLVFLGLISYSWYLWHWPILAFVRYLSLEPPSPLVRFVCLFVGLALAVVSWKFVEQPFRVRSRKSSGRHVLVYSVFSLTLITIIGSAYAFSSGFPSRISDFQLAAMNAEKDKIVVKHTVDDVRSDELYVLGDVDASDTPVLLVWGDSHAMSVLPAVDEVLRKHGLGGRLATASSTAPVVDWFYNSKYGLNDKAPEFNDAVIAYILSHGVEAVLLHAYWSVYAQGPDVKKLSFDKALLSTVEKLRNANVEVYLLLDVPIHSKHIPRLLASPTSGYSDESEEISLKIPQSGEGQFDSIDSTVIKRISELGAVVLDPKPIFSGSNEDSYKVYSEGIVLYRDSQHLTASGAKHLLVPFLEDTLGPGLLSQQRATDSNKVTAVE